MRRAPFPLLGLLLSAGLLQGEGVFDDDNPDYADDVRFGRAGPAVRKGFRPSPDDSIFESVAPPEPPGPKPVPEASPVVPSSITAPEIKPAGPRGVGELIEAGRFGEVARDAESRRDGPLALALAWAYYRKQDYANAGVWFAKASEWGGSTADIVFGRAVSALGDGDVDEAMRRVKPILKTEARARALYADLAAGKATLAYENSRYKEAVFLLEEAYRYRYLSTPEQLLLAWSYRRAGDDKRAGEIFEGLYRATKSRESSDGLIAVYGGTPPGRERLVALAGEVGGPLKENPALAGAGGAPGVRAYDAGRYYEAAAESPELALKTPGLTGPSLYVGGEYITRSGRAGLEQLSTATLPLVGARVILADRHEIEVRAAAVELRTGRPSSDSPVGSPPDIPVTYPPTPVPPFPLAPTTSVSGYEATLAYRYHDEVSPFAAIGIAPEGPVSRQPNGRLGVTWYGDKGSVEAEGFYQPVRDSLLSYTGIRDPWTGAKWGRVVSLGGKLSGTLQVEDGYSVSAGGFASYLAGRHVGDNQNAGVDFGLRKTLPLENFSYFAVGPDIAFTHYEKNLGKFTYGHGGYFSPDSLIRFDFGVNLLTTEGKRWLAKADGLVGYQMNRQDGAPYHPLNQDGRYFPEINAADFILGLRGEAALLLSPHWMMGGYCELSKAPNYDAFGIGLFFSYHFSRREGLFRQDLRLPLW